MNGKNGSKKIKRWYRKLQSCKECGIIKPVHLVTELCYECANPKQIIHRFQEKTTMKWYCIDCGAPLNGIVGICEHRPKCERGKQKFRKQAKPIDKLTVWGNCQVKNDVVLDTQEDSIALFIQ